ncbi:MAG: cytochrome oxidase small assembly protein [Burkholderiaceae bacterium]
MPRDNKPNNLRTGLILASIALAFFVGLFVKRIWLD